MTTWDEGVEYPELFRLISDYAQRDEFHQVKALSLIVDSYTPFGNLPMDDTKVVVESILQQHDYLLWFGGRPILAGIDAIVAVSKWSNDPVWGMKIFMTMLDSLLKGKTSAEHGLPHHQQSPYLLLSTLPDGVQFIVEGMRSLSAE